MNTLEVLYQAYLENVLNLNGKTLPTQMEMETKAFEKESGLTEELSNKLWELMNDREAFYERTGFFDGFKLAFCLFAEVMAK